MVNNCDFYFQPQMIKKSHNSLYPLLLQCVFVDRELSQMFSVWISINNKHWQFEYLSAESLTLSPRKSYHYHDYTDSFPDLFAAISFVANFYFL